MEKDPILNKIGEHKRLQIVAAIKNCSNDLSCLVTALKFNEQEIQQISTRLQNLYNTENEFGKLVSQHILPSGCYGLFKDLVPSHILVKAWEQDATAINTETEFYPLAISLQLDFDEPMDP